MENLGTLEAEWKSVQIEGDALDKALTRHKIEHTFLEIEKLKQLI